MSRDDIIARLKGILLDTDERSAAALDSCGEDAELTTDLGLNSVGMLFMVISIEESFGVVFENVAIGDFVTVRDVVDYLETRLKETGAL